MTPPLEFQLRPTVVRQALSSTHSSPRSLGYDSIMCSTSPRETRSPRSRARAAHRARPAGHRRGPDLPPSPGPWRRPPRPSTTSPPAGSSWAGHRPPVTMGGWPAADRQTGPRRCASTSPWCGRSRGERHPTGNAGGRTSRSPGSIPARTSPSTSPAVPRDAALAGELADGVLLWACPPTTCATSSSPRWPEAATRRQDPRRFTIAASSPPPPTVTEPPRWTDPRRAAPLLRAAVLPHDVEAAGYGKDLAAYDAAARTGRAAARESAKELIENPVRHRRPLGRAAGHRTVSLGRRQPHVRCPNRSLALARPPAGQSKHLLPACSDRVRWAAGERYRAMPRRTSEGSPMAHRFSIKLLADRAQLRGPIRGAASVGGEVLAVAAASNIVR